MANQLYDNLPIYQQPYLTANSSAVRIEKTTYFRGFATNSYLLFIFISIKMRIKTYTRILLYFLMFLTLLSKMNRINKLFEIKTKDILSIYFCAGYPDPDNTVDAIRTLEKNGINMVEIGIPFSDPMADGVIIQNASQHALRNGMTLSKIFEQLKNIRNSVQIPLIIMGYLNPIMQFGFEQFFKSCKNCGIDGCIIPDLPFDDYLADFKPMADRYNIKIIMLITPETSNERVLFIDQHTDGFIYMVSSASTTGIQKSFDEQKQNYFHRINTMNLRNPRMIGFGISNKATFSAACSNASGAIIGSKFVELMGENKSPETAIKKLLEMINN